MQTTKKRLNKSQMDRLKWLLREPVQIDGTGNFPVIRVPLMELLLCVRKHLSDCGISPVAIKLNGGAASFVVASRDIVFADLDLIFTTNCSADDSFDKVRTAIFCSLLELMPSTNKTRITPEVLKDCYMRKMIKVDSGNGDRWSLFSLHNEQNRCLELKFVDSMRRQYEFSVDSFQIELDSLLQNPNCLTANVYSVYGDVEEALHHLEHRLIQTNNPEEIRGGGLLKYCHLLARGFKAAQPERCHDLEKYMCSRFFIDFPDLQSQETKLRSYMESHFGTFESWSCTDETDSEASTSQTPSALAVSQAKYDFLMLLHRVISESTVCLMTHERKHTLQLIDRMAFRLSMSPSGPGYSQYASSSPSSSPGGFTPRPMLLYFPANSVQWIPVV